MKRSSYEERSYYSKYNKEHEYRYKRSPKRRCIREVKHIPQEIFKSLCFERSWIKIPHAMCKREGNYKHDKSICIIPYIYIYIYIL